MIRNNLYDTLGTNISKLRNKMAEQNEVIQKSDWDNDLEGTANEIIANHNELKELAGAINSQFKELKEDYRTGRINLVRYQEKLKELKDLLINSGEKITIPELGAGEMVQEIQKYI